MTVGRAAVDLRIGDYEILYHHPTLGSGKAFKLSQAVEQLAWSYSVKQASREINIRLSHHEGIKNVVREGGIITVFGQALFPDKVVPNSEIMRGVIFDTDVGTEKTSTSTFDLTAYDHLIYTVKNEETKKFSGLKASQIISQLCNEFDIPVGVIEDTGVVLPLMIFRKATIYDMMVTVLTESRWIDGQRFVMRMEQGKLFVMKKRTPNQVFVLAYGKNLYSARLRKSISNMRNKIVLYGSQTQQDPFITAAQEEELGAAPDDNDTLAFLGEAIDNEMVSKYGYMQALEIGDVPSRFSEVQEYVRELLKTMSRVEWQGNVVGPNYNTLYWGDAINVYEPLTGLGAEYYVVSGKHVVSAAGAKMELEIHFEDLLPEKFYSEYEGSGSSIKDPFIEALIEEGLIHDIQGRIDGDTKDRIKYERPLQGNYVVTQEFGENPQSYQPKGHRGIDLAAPGGTPVYSAGRGTVIQAGAGPDKNAGVYVVIEHPDALRTVYAHLKEGSLKVAKGEFVALGWQIGAMDSTGLSTGDHLHFEVVREGAAINPRYLVPKL